MRRLAGRPSAISSADGGARVDTTAGCGAVKVGGAVAAAAVVGAAAAAVSEFSKRQLAVSFFRWEGAAGGGDDDGGDIDLLSLPSRSFLENH